MRRKVLEELRRGHRLREVAVRHRLPYEFVRLVAAESGEEYVGRHLTTAQEREIRQRRDIEGQSVRTIAREMGLPKSKVGRFVRRVFLDVIADEDDVGFEDTEAKRCPVHGWVRVWPCVACRANGGADQ